MIEIFFSVIFNLKKYLVEHIKLISIVLITSVLFFHLWSLSIYPIPWFDETLFASIGKDFFERGHFFPWVAPFSYKFHECVTYGPVYFFIQAISYLFLGFNSFASRISGFLFGVMMVWSYVKLYRSFNERGPVWIEYLLMLCLFFDYTVFESFHLGRMEPVAIFFLNVSVLLQLRSLQTQNPKRQYFLAICYSAFALLAVLTTPRAGILLVPSGLLLFFNWVKEKRSSRFIEFIIMGFMFLILLSAWIIYAFGNIQNMIDYYKVVNSTSNFWFSFSFRKSIYIYQYPAVLVCTAIAILTGFILKRKSWNPLTLYCSASILFFYTIVFMLRPYCIYTLPIFYLLAAHSIRMLYLNESASKFFRVISATMFSGIFVMMLLVTSAKAFYIFKSAADRNPKAIDAFVHKNIPANSKVIGDEVYYYSVLKSGSEFQYMHWYETDEYREKYQREVFDFDYIFISDGLMKFNPTILKLYSSHSDLQLIADFEPALNPITNYVNVKQPLLVSFFTYNGHLYKRIKK